MAKKLGTIFSLFLLLFGLMPALQVKAGVVKQLVEVDPGERKKLEEERVRRQEEYRKEALDQVVQQKKEEPKPVPAPVIEKEPEPVIADATPIPEETKHVHNGALCFMCKILGSVSGLVVGPIAGLVRGSVSKGVDHADDLSDAMGDGMIGSAIGIPAGGLTGIVTGAVTGIPNGMITGLVKGWEDPFTSESYSLEGKFLDYDPYHFLGGME